MASFLMMPSAPNSSSSLARFSIPLISSKSFAISFLLTPLSLTSSSCFAGATKNDLYDAKPKRLRASADGISDELIEDSKFVPVTDNDPTFGPPALLLLGFDLDEKPKIKQLLRDLDGDFMEVIYCTEEMIAQSLWKAINTLQSSHEGLKIAKSVPRICFLSGLSGEETMMFIDAFPEAGLKPAVFAALVPNSADKPLQELIDEIMGDHEMMTGRV